MADLSESTLPIPSKAILAITCYAFNFRIPKTKQINFKDCFQLYLDNPDTSNFIMLVTHLRAAMTTELSTFDNITNSGSGNSSPQSKLRSVDDYFPKLLTLWNSIAKSETPVDVKVPLRYEWRGGLTLFEGFYSHQDILFEVVMVFHAKAILHYQLGKQYAASISSLTNAGQEFINAANTMQFLCEYVYPKWKLHVRQFPNGIQPTEIFDDISRGLVAHYRSLAQQMAFAKALTKEGQQTGNGTLLKIVLSIVEDSKIAVDLFKNDQLKIDADFITFVYFQFNIFRAIAFVLQAKVNEEKGQYGKAIGYLNKALTFLEEKAKPLPTDFPKMIGKFESLQNPMKDLRLYISDVIQSSQRFNDFVYFQEVPKLDTLVISSLGTGIQIMKMTNINPLNDLVNQAPIPFIKNTPAQSGISKMFSSLALGAGNTSNNPVNNQKSPTNATVVTNSTSTDTTRARSDSDLARELQRKIDAGEDI